MYLFFDIVEQRIQRLVEKPYFIIEPYRNRKSFLEILSPHDPASHFVCMYVLSLYTLYVNGMLKHRGGGVEGEIVYRLKAGKWVGYLHSLYLKIGLSHYFGQ